MWTCNPSYDYLGIMKTTCKSPELHTMMKNVFGTGLVLKKCETRNKG